MKINLHNKKFRPLQNTANGEVSAGTVFHYTQEQDCIFARYEGGGITQGRISGKIIDDTWLLFHYAHVNADGEMMSGTCRSYPQTDEKGKIILKEYWQWTCKDYSSGESTIIEI